MRGLRCPPGVLEGSLQPGRHRHPAQRPAAQAVPVTAAGVQPVDGVGPERLLDAGSDRVQVDAEGREQRGVVASVRGADAGDQCRRGSLEFSDFGDDVGPSGTGDVAPVAPPVVFEAHADVAVPASLIVAVDAAFAAVPFGVH